MHSETQSVLPGSGKNGNTGGIVAVAVPLRPRQEGEVRCDLIALRPILSYRKGKLFVRAKLPASGGINIEGEISQLRATSVTVPPTDDRLVVRERLLSRLDHATRHRLVLIQAPAGFGKTSLLVTWIHRQQGGRRFAWLALDDSHADPRAILRGIVAALRASCGPVGEATLALLGANVPVSTGSLITTLQNELLALPGEVWIALDDLHLVGNGEAAKCIEALVQHAPQQLHFIATSREGAPFALGRLRQLGQLYEIGTSDLEFTTGEVRSFIAREALNLTSGEADLLASNTGGWAAGLRLAAISMRDEPSSASFLGSFSGGHSAIAEFLQEDVLERQTAELQTFLTEASLLDVFSASVCDTVLGRDDSAVQLQVAYGKGLFMVSASPDGSRFRFHRMFADYLRQRLWRERPSRARQICVRASEWYEQQGEDYEAIEFALQAQDTAAATRLLEAASERLFAAGRLETLQKFAGRLTDTELDSCPKLLLDLVWIHTLNWQTRSAAVLIDRVKTILSTGDGAVTPQLREKILHREIMIALLADRLPEAYRLWKRWPTVSTTDNLYFDGSAETAALMARRERFDCRFVISQAARVRRKFTDIGVDYGTIWFDCCFAPALLMHGDASRAREILEGAAEVASRTNGPQAPLNAMPALLLAEVLLEQGFVESAAVLVETWLPRASEIGFADQLIAGYLSAVRIAAANARHDHALSLLEEGELLANEYEFDRVKVHLAGERVRLLLSCGREHEAREHVRRNALLQRDSMVPGRLATATDAVVALARARTALGTKDAALRIKSLQSWIKYLEGHECLRFAIQFRLVLSGLLHAAGDTAHARRVLVPALDQASVSGIVQPLVEEGDKVMALIDLAGVGNGGEQAASRAAIDRLRLRMNSAEEFTETSEEMSAPPNRQTNIEPLTQRQREILAAVADGSSNKEVAARLGVTEATVKWHLRLVYEKLGVHRRTAAVREARARGIIR